MADMGSRIRQKRIEKGLTMEELGNALGIKASAINKYEKGIVENIKRSTIQQMATIFECDPAWLMGFDESNSVNNFISKSTKQLALRPFTDEELDLIESFRSLDEESQRQLILMAAFYKDQQDKKEH